LLEAFRRGERDALERVYRTYVREVFRMLRHGFTLSQAARVPGLSEDEALDAVQEVFVKAFEERARLGYDGERPYRPYLFQILRNLRVDALRKGAPRLPTGEAGELVEVGPSPEAALHWERLRRVAESFVAELDEETRRFVALRFADELSQRDAAEALGVTRRHVRTLEEGVTAGLLMRLRAPTSRTDHGESRRY
jgi:RNA polymerase sigma-70 factor (ECF subfamily)